MEYLLSKDNDKHLAVKFSMYLLQPPPNRLYRPIISRDYIQYAYCDCAMDKHPKV